jgi:poly-gamma-glutamate synthesis protein (capsule biosynthesis protein)
MYYYDNTDFFAASIKPFTNTKPLNPSPHLFIVNQHILAAHLIAQQFALAANPNIKNVILITQNNWNAGRAPIIISEQGWKTPLGNIVLATDIAKTLITKNLVTPEEEIFTHEHGITGIVPYIAHYFPQAAVLPIVIRDGTSEKLTQALATELATFDPSTTVIVGSIDMSHYLPKYAADAHDRLTLQTIQSFDYASLPRLDIDTVPTLRTIMNIAEVTHQQHFVQTGGINSADIVKDPQLISTTSYLTGYFMPGEPMAATTTHLLFVGDMMFDREIAKHATAHGPESLFANIERLFLGNHAVIGNLEGTITNKPSVAARDYSVLHFTFNPLFAALLEKMGVTAVSLANNHALDFGGDGYRQTLQYVQQAHIASFGSPRNDMNLSTQLTVQGKKLCLVGYHDLFVPNDTPIVQEIKNIRPDCGLVVVFTHWGVEYQISATARQKMLAHHFIDAGADIVIGAHPHVVEPIEIYKNKAIFYSLGNFVFDQKLSFATEHGLAVQVEYNDDMTRFTLVPTALVDDEVHIAPAAEAEKVLQVAGNSLSADMRSAILKTNTFILWNNNPNQ